MARASVKRAESSIVIEVRQLTKLVGAVTLTALSLPRPWSHRIGKFTLLGAAYQTVSIHPSRTLLSPALSVLVLIAWPDATFAAAGFLITHRDT